MLFDIKILDFEILIFITLTFVREKVYNSKEN